MKRKKKLLRADLLPIIFTLALLPLVAKGQEVEISLDNYSWFPDGGFQYDFFMYWKEIIFLILAGWMLCNAYRQMADPENTFQESENVYATGALWWINSAVNDTFGG